MRFVVYALLVLVVAGGYAVTHLSRQVHISYPAHALALREGRSGDAVTFSFATTRTGIPPWKPVSGALILVKGKDLREVEILDPAGRRLHHFALAETCNPLYPIYCRWRLAPGGGAFLAALPKNVDVQIVDLAAGEERLIMHQRGPSGRNFNWLDDERLFLPPSHYRLPATVMDDRGQRALSFRLVSQEEKVLPPEDISLEFIDILPEGQGALLYIFLTGPSDVWRQMIGLWDERSGKIELFAPSGERRCENAFVIPGKASFVIECSHWSGYERIRTTLYEASPGAAPRKVMTLPGSEELAGVSPSGQRLVLAVRDQQSRRISSLRILDRRTGSDFTFEISVNWHGVVGPVDFAPDGETLYVVESGAGGRLWRVDLATGSRTALAEGVHWVAVIR